MDQVFSMTPAPDRTMWMVTAIVVVILAIAALLIYTGYSSKHVDFHLSRDSLRISGDLFGRTVALASLDPDRAAVVNLATSPELAPRRRSWGTGLPGYRVGWFRLRNGEKALVYMTDRRRVVYLPTNEGYSLLLSVADAPRFLEAVRRNLSSSTND